jgi:hypothetical protein
MKARPIYCLAVAFVFVCCTLIVGLACKQKPANSKKETTKEAKKQAKPPSSYQDTLHIETPAAVFYYPDSIQLEKIKSLTDPQVLDGSIHEYYYLQKNARKEVGIFDNRLPIFDAKNVRFLLFINNGKIDTCIDLDTRNDAFGMFISTPLKKPHSVDMANIDRELSAYFGN